MMKGIVSKIVVALFALTLHSCSKKGAEPGSLSGIWNVVNDSSTNTNKLYTLSAQGNGVASSDYMGEQCSATFTFNPNGILATSFFNCSYGYPTVDSAKYLQTGGQLTISIFGQNSGCCSFTYFNPVITRTYTVSNFTASTATLSFRSGASGGQAEVIHLKK